MNQPPGDDTVLLQKIVQQEQAALSQLYGRYARVLYAMALKILNSVDEAEEVVLDVFAQVWKTAHSYDPHRAQVDAWLFMLTRSRALDRLRKRRQQAQTIQRATVEKAVTTRLRSLELTPEEQLLIWERQELITEALNQLPDAQKEALELAYYKGLTYKEIAAHTNTSLGTVKTRLRLALSKLRRILNQSQF